MSDDPRRRVDDALDRAQRRYEGHGKIFAVAWTVAAVTVLLAGLAMTIFPGPAMLVVPVALAMLAVQFAWARRLLEGGVDAGLAVKERADAVGPTTKLFAVVITGCAVAGVVVWLVSR